MDNLHIDEDGLSDEYDFMDDADTGDGARRRDRSTGGPKKKYMAILQDIADRNTTQVLIELDDVDEVRYHGHGYLPAPLICNPLQYEKSLDGQNSALKLVESIEKNANSYIELLARAVDKVMPQPSKEPT